MPSLRKAQLAPKMIRRIRLSPSVRSHITQGFYTQTRFGCLSLSLSATLASSDRLISATSQTVKSRSVPGKQGERIMPQVEVKTQSADAFKQEIKSASHHFVADAPKEAGGTDGGPDP